MAFPPLTAKTAEAYAEAFRALLPPGLIWEWLWYAGLEDLALGIGDTLVRWHDRWIQASLEAYPGTASETLDAWERNANLPDPLAPTPTTDSERQAALVGRLGAFGGQDRPYFEGWSDRMLGILTALCDERAGGEPFRVGINRAGDPLTGLWGAYYWTVEVPSTIAADDRDRLEAYLDRMRPARSTVAVVATAEDRWLAEDGTLIITEGWRAIELE